ncbi:unnamed protein product [Zymoseptoria tritici ST99CH_1E4]|uniref:Uncharacterized protein n=1 Tax=Zymoseptoria tritici ST99CH_1E4 TaxID=1276532 RepID=A0A2H1GZ67_ZYMTR|nr:unnamed protein product [Zymoseptoria tritici ST99CH_1E4]
MDNSQHSCSCAANTKLPSDVYIYFALNLLVLSYALSRKHSLDVADPSKVTTGVASNIHAQTSSPWARLKSAAVEILNDFFDSASRKATLVYDSIAKSLSTRRTSTIVAVGFMAGLMCASMLVSLLGAQGLFASVSTLVKDTIRFGLIAHVETMLRLINWLRPAGRPSLLNEFWPHPGYIGYNIDGTEVAFGCAEALSTSFRRYGYPSNSTFRYTTVPDLRNATIPALNNTTDSAGRTPRDLGPLERNMTILYLFGLIIISTIVHYITVTFNLVQVNVTKERMDAGSKYKTTNMLVDQVANHSTFCTAIHGPIHALQNESPSIAALPFEPFAQTSRFRRLLVQIFFLLFTTTRSRISFSYHIFTFLLEGPQPSMTAVTNATPSPGGSKMAGTHDSTLDVFLLIACALGVAVLLVRHKQSFGFSKSSTATIPITAYCRANVRAALNRREKKDSKTRAAHILIVHGSSLKRKFLTVIRSFCSNHGPELVFFVVVVIAALNSHSISIPILGVQHFIDCIVASTKSLLNQPWQAYLRLLLRFQEHIQDSMQRANKRRPGWVEIDE